MRFILAALVLLLASSGCSGCDSEEEGGEGGRAPVPEDEDWETALELVDRLPQCDVEHRGLLLDMGSDSMVGRYRGGLEPPEDIVDVEHDGATWARIYQRKLTIEFHLPKVSPTFVSLRLVGADSRRVNVAIDGYLLDIVKFSREKVETVSSRTSRLPLDPGLHRLELRFRGRKKSDSEPYAEVDWIRIGVPDELDRTYGAPTLDDMRSPAAEIGGEPHRALSVRAPGSVRCTLRVPPFARLRTAVGMRGSGEGSGAILIHREGGGEKLLEKVDASGGAEASWTDLDIPLHDYAYEMITVEMRTTKTTGTGRLMFGDPTVFVPARSDATTPEAKAVVVVVLDGVTKRDLPPWRPGDTPHLPTLSDVAEEWAVFDDHRAPSTLVSAVMASLVTGRSPRAHTLADSGAQLPPSIRTLGAFAREASVRAAMFTSVPTSFSFFGFGRHWERFEPFPPNGKRLASAPMVDAGKFLTGGQSDSARPMFALLHARGGHPPWEVTPEEAAELPPEEYAGVFDPRRAAQQLAELGGRHTRLSDHDKQRLRALFFAGLARQDQALGALVTRLEEAELFDETLFIITGDVAAPRESFFADGLPLSEKRLSIPLYVHFPGGEPGGVRIDRPTEIYDVTRTVLGALDIRPPPELRGRDLYATAVGREDVGRLRIAYLDEHYSARLGHFVLWGEPGDRRLCALEVDPTCAYDRAPRHPAIAQALFRRLTHDIADGGEPPDRKPLELQSEEAAMLEVWGAY